MKKFSSKIAAGATCLVAGLSITALAETSRNTALEEITVTATKRDETAQDVPASISTLGGDAIAERGLTSLKDVSALVPNLNWGESNGTTMLTIRGVGSTVDSGVTEPTIAMYVDGIFLPRATMATVRPVDLQRVEVLRGPQGTLYGRNATGGAINFISVAPSNAFEAGINLSTGSRDAFGISGYVSGPLSDTLSGRLSGGHEEQDGYVKVINTGKKLNGTDVDYLRGALRLEATDALAVDLSARYERNDAAVTGNQPTNVGAFFPPELQSTKKNRLIADQPYSYESETLIAGLTIAWEISNNLSLTSLTSYVDHETNNGFDADGTGVDFYNVTNNAFERPSESYGQEFNLVGDMEDFNWILGAYFFHDDAGNSLPVRVGANFGLLPPEIVLGQSVDSDITSYALFGDLTYSINDRLRLILGLRFNKEEQDFEQNFYISGIVPEIVSKFSNSTTDTLPKIGLQYDFTDNISGYAQWAKGVKSGGANLPGGGGELLGKANGLYKPEEIDAYEVGLKTQSEDRSLTLNMAVFYYDYSDLQVTVVIPPAVTKVNNADAQVYGAEAELTWQATPSLKLNAATTLTHARFDGFGGVDQATGLFTDLDDQPLPRAPDYTVNLGAAYEIDLGGSLLSSLTLRADYFYTDDYVIRYFGQPADSQESYSLLNLSASISNDDEHTKLSVFVQNATDEIYKMNVADLGLGIYYANYSAPRTVGVQLSQKF